MAPLLSLPNELLQEIASYLDLPELACLTLSCRSMYHILGTKSFQALNRQLRYVRRCDTWSDPTARRTVIDELARFLGALSTCTEKYWFCDSCMILHYKHRLGGSHHKDRVMHEHEPNWNLSLDLLPTTDGKPVYSLTWYLAYLVCNNTHRICLSALKCSGTYECIDYFISARVCSFWSDGLYHASDTMVLGARYQIRLDDDCIFSPSSGKVNIPKRGMWYHIVIAHGLSRICNHVTVGQSIPRERRMLARKHDLFGVLPDLIACRWKHRVKGEGFCEECRNIRRCPVCPTEFDVHFLHEMGQWTDLVVEVWHHLGALGTPGDNRWRSITGPATQARAAFKLGDIRLRYQGGYEPYPHDVRLWRRHVTD